MSHIKQLLEHASNASLGSAGEQLYATSMQNTGHSVTWVHSNGTDCCIDNTHYVDVKTTRGNTIHRVPTQQRTPGVEYVYVLIDCKESTTPVQIFNDTKQLLHTLSIDEVTHILSKKDITQSTKTSPQFIKDLRKRYPTLHIGYRSRYFRQKGTDQYNMCKNGWCPESFYLPDTKTHAIFYHMHEGNIMEIHAYPITRRDEVGFRTNWKKNKQVMTYDIWNLPTDFIFSKDATINDILERFKK